MKKVKVICPNCNGIVPAEVGSDPTNTGFYHTYIAECQNCDYIIMESEWDEIEKI
jgi:hypothetical protein